ncbi:MAG: DUF4159 domain-containing protein [Flavobacteriales bacterium]|nr:DUF4159 domain-containing protein [Flavobacteriales bacterium]
MKKLLILLIVPMLLSFVTAPPSYKIAVLKYRGGGDYYANPTSVPNLVQFVNKNLNMNIDLDVPFIDVGSPEIINYPFVHMTGHGNVVFSADDAENLRNYLIGGGFLHISDNYGMDKFIRKELKKVFPELELIELPFSHPVYHQAYQFQNGLPKIHEHDKKAPQGFGLVYEGRLVLFYDVECDLGDGWEDYEVHKDSDEARQKALRMGANLLQFALMGNEDE